MFAPTTTDDQCRLFLQQHLVTARSHALVVEENDCIDGYRWARVVEASPLDASWPRRFVEIDTLVVAAHAQGAGVGRWRTLQRQLAVER